MIVYTSLFGNRDAPRKDIPCYQKNTMVNSDVLSAKIYKILPHLFFPNENIFMWVDANIYLKKDKQYYVDKYLGDSDIVFCSHGERKNIFEEAEKLKHMNYFKSVSNVIEQVKEYKAQGFTKDILYGCSVLIRKNNALVNRMCELWWAHITRWQSRDQISLPFVVDKFPDLKINTVKWNDIILDFIRNKHSGEL